MKISATIITFNEASNIQAACDSVRWADEIVVVDSESTDATRDIATAAGAKVTINPWPGFAAQKQFAVEQATHEWIFSLDADERCSEELQNSIRRLRDKTTEQLADGYQIARRTFYQGRWIKGGGWYPDRQLRLFKKSAGHWKKRLIHESVEMNPRARVEVLAGDLLHYTVRDAAYHHRMIGERYAPLAAQQMFAEGRRTSTIKIATAAPSAFIRSLVLKAGFRDGLAGLSIASFAAHHAFLKNLMLWEMQKKKAEDRG
ncbi:MAG TPA: glycosyltransferase family 2 protein [Pyrinomonadaceae bacterium]